MDRYVVISSDCHAGADLRDYRPYLEASYREEFDAWADGYVHPFRDLQAADANRNWDSAVRMPALESDGVVGEVLYPNTVPPFFPISGLISLTPSVEDFSRRLAGLRAHNRWLAEFCAEYPDRRAGIGQILLNDVSEAVRDVHWIADHDLRGGVLLPGAPPGSGIAPLHSPEYDPIWQACEERGVLVNVHGGGGTPDFGMHPASLAMFVLEAGFYSHRPLWSLVMSGVFDRFPGLRLVIAEAGMGWVPNVLSAMDHLHGKLLAGNVGELPLTTAFCTKLQPSEYVATNVWIGASFMTRGDCLARDQVGVDRIMWGSDFPHKEGTFPYSAEALANTFEGVSEDEVAKMLGETAAALYGFDFEALRPLGDQYGPSRKAVMAGLETLPDSESLAFEERAASVA